MVGQIFVRMLQRSANAYPLICKSDPLQGMAFGNRKNVTLANAEILKIDDGIGEILRSCELTH